MEKNNKIAEIAFNKLLPILISPDSGEKLNFDSNTKTLQDSKGYNYHTEKFIPILLPKSKIQDSEFDYLEHYKQDAEQFDYFEDRSSGTLHEETRVREYILSRINGEISTILDVGCGNGWLAKVMLNKNIFICSLDAWLSNPMKAINLYPSENHTAVVADALCLPFSDESFEVIVASEIIEHIGNPKNFVSELIRCLKPGGKLIITTPYKEVIKYYLCIHCNKQTPVNAHLHSFDEIKLMRLINDSRIVSSWTVFGNKALIHLRTHVILKYLPFSVWKIVDSIANLFINKRAHILVEFIKGTY